MNPPPPKKARFSQIVFTLRLTLERLLSKVRIMMWMILSTALTNMKVILGSLNIQHLFRSRRLDKKRMDNRYSLK